MQLRNLADEWEISVSPLNRGTEKVIEPDL
jgi:hypothetical protein